MEFIIGGAIVVLMLLCAAGGAYLGMQMAVDNTMRDGYFKAYDKKWKAVEVVY